VALGVTIFGLWQHYSVIGRLEALQAAQAQFAATNDELHRQLSALEDRVAVNDRRTEELGRLSAQFAQLSGSVDELRERADAGQRGWIMAEARYLLEIANRRLTLERDTGSALAAMLTADERLRMARDPAVNPVRRKLAGEIQTLRSLPQPDLAGIASRLAAAEELSSDLAVLGAVSSRYQPPMTTPDQSSGILRAWQVLHSSFAGMISIRRIGKDAAELVSLEEQGVRRHHLQLLLFAARVAALRADQPGFRASVSNARHWLDQMFDPADTRVVGLRRELQELEKIDIAPSLPDISGSLRMLERVGQPERAPRAP
jgi:uroporphyrin-3 C-methyltransferase